MEKQSIQRLRDINLSNITGTGILEEEEERGKEKRWQVKVNERIETTDQRTSETSPIPSPQKPSTASPNTGELQEAKDTKTQSPEQCYLQRNKESLERSSNWRRGLPKQTCTTGNTEKPSDRGS